MIEKRRTTGPRIGPRLTPPQPAPPPTVMQLGSDRVLAGAREVDIAQLRPDPDQPRKSMRPDRLAELAESILQHGLLQPLVVRQEGLAPDGDMRYVVIAGGRRYAALKLLLDRPLDGATRARITRVRVIVNESEATERRVLQLIENLQREDLSPVEEARSLKEIMHVEALTTTELASRVHRSQGYIDERLRLLRYEEVEAAVEAGWLTKSAGAAIASLSSADARQSWLARASDGETIRPRDVYATKAKNANGTPLSPLTDPTVLPKFGKAEEGAPAGDDRLPNIGNVGVDAERVTVLPNFGKAGTEAPPVDDPLPKFGNTSVHPLPVLELPNFGNGAIENAQPVLRSENEAVEVLTKAAALLPNFGNLAAASAAERDAITFIRALRIHLAAISLPTTREARTHIATELEATSETIQRLLAALHGNSR